VRLGFHLPQLGRVVTPDLIIDIAQRAEAAGFDDVWTSDHIAVPEGMPSFFPEPVPLLALAAGHTSRVGLGTSVIIAAYRNPMQFAKQWATLDWLAPGRTILGVGAGWLEIEFDACGIPFERRGERLDDYIAGWRAVWAGERSFESRHFSFHDVRVMPRPQPPARIWIGGSSRGAIRRAARNDGWHPTWSPPEVFTKLRQQLVDEIDHIGRSQSDVTVSMHLEVGLGQQSASTGVWASVGDGYGDRKVSAGSLDALAEDLAAYGELGLDHVLLTPQCRSVDDWHHHVDALGELVSSGAR
jgi:probable F420-dependent oxidoreductase